MAGVGTAADTDTTTQTQTQPQPPTAAPPAPPVPTRYDPTSATPYIAPEAPQLPTPPSPPKTELPNKEKNNLTFGGGTRGAIGSIATIADSILKGAIKGRENAQAKQAAQVTQMINGATYQYDTAKAQMKALAQQPEIAEVLRKGFANPKYQPTPEEMATIQPYLDAKNGANTAWKVRYTMQGKVFGFDTQDKKGKKKQGEDDNNPLALMATQDPKNRLKASWLITGKIGDQSEAEVRELLSKTSAQATEPSASEQKAKLESHIATLNAIPPESRTPEQAKDLKDTTQRLHDLDTALAPPAKPSHPSDYAQGLRRFVEKEGGDPDNPTAAQESAYRTSRAAETRPAKTVSRDDRYIDIMKRHTIDPKSITPDEAAFVSAYDQWVKKTKTDPGVARMAALSNFRYIPVIDPSDPTGQNVILEHSAEAAQSHAALPASAGFQAEKAVLKSATSGKLGETLNYFNTATSHLALLGAASTALANGNVQGMNRLAQSFATATGSAAPVNFDAIKSAVVGEVAKTFQGGRATQAEIKTLSETINHAQSPEQLRGAIGSFTALLNSKREAVEQQIKSGLQGRPNFQGSGTPSASTHVFDVAAWKTANPGKNADAAIKKAKSLGYEVIGQ